MAGREFGGLAGLLEQLGLQKYQQVFLEAEIDLGMLVTLTDSELKEVGITKLGPRRKLTAAIARLRAEAGHEPLLQSSTAQAK